MRRHGAAAILLALITLALLPPASAAAAPSGSANPLTASATPDVGAVGAVVRVDGSGWTRYARLQLATCGGLAVSGAGSCDLTGAFSLVGGGGGRFSVQFRLGRPPVPCPCVIQVSEAGSGRTVAVPVQIADVPSAAPPAPTLTATAPAVSVVAADLAGRGPWTALFGAGPARTLVLTVHNNSGSAITAVPLELSDSAEPAARGDLARTTVGPLPAGGTATFRVPVRFPAGFGGSYAVHGTIATSTAFSADMHAFPWGMYGLAAAVLALAALAIARPLAANAARRRAGDAEDPLPDRVSAGEGAHDA